MSSICYHVIGKSILHEYVGDTNVKWNQVTYGFGPSGRNLGHLSTDSSSNPYVRKNTCWEMPTLL